MLKKARGNIGGKNLVLKLILKLGSWGDWSGLRQMTPYFPNNTNKAHLLSPDHAASRLVKKGSDLGTSLVFFSFGAPGRYYRTCFQKFPGFQDSQYYSKSTFFKNIFQ